MGDSSSSMAGFLSKQLGYVLCTGPTLYPNLRVELTRGESSAIGYSCSGPVIRSATLLLLTEFLPSCLTGNHDYSYKGLADLLNSAPSFAPQRGLLFK